MQELFLSKLAQSRSACEAFCIPRKRTYGEHERMCGTTRITSLRGCGEAQGRKEGLENRTEVTRRRFRDSLAAGARPRCLSENFGDRPRSLGWHTTNRHSGARPRWAFDRWASAAATLTRTEEDTRRHPGAVGSKRRSERSSLPPTNFADQYPAVADAARQGAGRPGDGCRRLSEPPAGAVLTPRLPACIARAPSGSRRGCRSCRSPAWAACPAPRTRPGSASRTRRASARRR